MARKCARGARVLDTTGAGGGTRGSYCRHCCVESLLLVTAGGALAWGFAQMATRLLGRWRRSSPAWRAGQYGSAVPRWGAGDCRAAVLASPACAWRCACRAGAGAEELQRRLPSADGAEWDMWRCNDDVRSAAGGAGLLLRTLQNLKIRSLGNRMRMGSLC